MALVAFVNSMLLISGQALAQATEKVDVNINADSGSSWYASPWVWALGVAIFIIIIVAITRGNSRTAD
ncbi:MAG: hypothetical protein K0S09_3134 [Sphingobacteriaceae bacterium]|nr:hypothetical protein [Sphingobacteriaceae bacterium]